MRASMACSSEHGVLQPPPDLMDTGLIPDFPIVPPIRLRILVLGAIGVGKSSFCYEVAPLPPVTLPTWERVAVRKALWHCESIYPPLTLGAIRKREVTRKKQEALRKENDALQRKQELCSRNRCEGKSRRSRRYSLAAAHVLRKANHRVHQNHHNRRCRW